MITNRTNSFSDLNFSEGEIILIDKPSDWTSFDVVHKIRNAVNVKKVGHAGTLDPKATGLLIIATGRKTKELERFQMLDKTYSGTMLLGMTSASMDLETECIAQPLPDNLNEKLIFSLRDEFLGEVVQLAPMYSALKVNGKRLYELARKGKSVERLPRKVFIEKFEITKIILPEIFFKITCSKGTYIRVLANDFGERLGCGAVLSNLRRRKIGEFDVKDALTVSEFIKKVEETEPLSVGNEP